jgi:hypothetical protein
MKRIALLMAACMLVGVGFFGYKHYRQHQVVSAIAPIVKDGTVKMLSAIAYETDRSHITTGEAFERLDSVSNDIEELKVKIQLLSNARTPEIFASSLKYLNTCQELTRIVAAKYRAELGLKHKITTAEAAVERARTNNFYPNQKAAIDKSAQAVVDMFSTLTEAKNYVKEQGDMLAQLKTSRAEAEKFLPDDALISVEQLNRLATSNAVEVSSVKP